MVALVDAPPRPVKGGVQQPGVHHPLLQAPQRRHAGGHPNVRSRVHRRLQEEGGQRGGAVKQQAARQAANRLQQALVEQATAGSAAGT